MTDIIPPKLCECGCGQPVRPGRRFIRSHHWRGDSETARSLHAKSGATRRRQPPAGPLNLCECGCGQPVKPGNRFIYGHNWQAGTEAAKIRAAKSAATRRSRRPVRELRRLPCECGCGELATPGKRFIQWHRRRSLPPAGEPKPCECGCGQPVKPGRRFIGNHHVAGDSETARRNRAKGAATRRSRNLARRPSPLLCECGCGLPAKLGNRFIYGHQRRGSVQSASTRAKMGATKRAQNLVGERSPSFGTKRSPETKAKQRALKVGKPLTPEHRAKLGMRGEKHPNWKGGRQVGVDRYVIVWVDPSHPMFSMAGWGPHGGSYYIREHRLVMAEHIGRPLTSEEVVHHKLEIEGGSGDTKDNRIENLVLFPDQAAHMSHHKALLRATKAKAALEGLKSLPVRPVVRRGSTVTCG